MGFFYCFLTNIFQITFKYIQNIVIFCFQFVEFPWEKYNMLGLDEDGRMLFLCNELLQALRRRGAEEASAPSPQSFLTMRPFFEEPFKFAFFENNKSEIVNIQ